MESIIEIKNLTKRYGKVEALQDLCLTVHEGICGLVGPNGAGKTTLIKICAGKLKPDSGKCLVLGSDDIRAIRNELGILHDRVSLPPEVTVEFFLEKTGKLLDVDNGQVDKTISLCSLEDVRAKKIGALSLGFRKRLGMAQAILHSPRLVIADEPFSQLDPTTRMKMRDVMIELWEDRGTSFLISSHDLWDLEQVSHHIIALNDGKVVMNSDVLDSTGVMIRANDNDELLNYLIKNDYDAKIDGHFVVLKNAEIREVLGLLAGYGKAIQEIRSSSLEYMLRNVLSG